MVLFFSYNTEDPDCYRDLANIRYMVIAKRVRDMSSSNQKIGYSSLLNSPFDSLAIIDKFGI